MIESGAMAPEIRDDLVPRLRESRVRIGVSLREMTTLRIGGPADVFVDVESEADLAALFEWIEAEGRDWFLLGKGSNLLAPDGGFRGVVIRLGRGLSGLDRDGEGRVTAGAGLASAAFVSRCRELGLGGMEFLVAVPGTIGGAVAMNAGAHDGETARFLESVRIYERGRIATHPARDFEFGYRASPLRGQSGRAVIAASFRLESMTSAEIRDREAEFQRYRRKTQPRDFPNCGSVFKNPPGDFAARLVEAAGLKGRRLGGAQVSEIHANFIVNREGATASEVLELIDLIQNTVYQGTGTRLEMELQIIGADPQGAPREYL